MKIEETKLKEQADFLKFIIYQSIPIQSAIIKKIKKIGSHIVLQHSLIT